jgi:hypothetical protein
MPVPDCTAPNLVLFSAGKNTRDATSYSGRSTVSRDIRWEPTLIPSHRRLELEVAAQPDDQTCGPTCLHSVYRYWGDEASLPDVIDEVAALPEGGTLAVLLADHALRRGYSCELYTYNLHVFDPTWFDSKVDIADRLRRQMRVKDDPKLTRASQSYLEYLELGGTLHFEQLTARLIQGFLNRGLPVLTGLSATYLYGCARENDVDYDDIGGSPTGHFVVLCGYDRKSRHVMVADPLLDNPLFGSHYYSVKTEHLIGAILLGIVTYDANLLIVTPKTGP